MNVNTFWRMVATGIMWLMLAGVSLGALYSPFVSDINVTDVVVVPLIIGALGMFFIWAIPEIAKASQVREEIRAGSHEYADKAKRGGGEDKYDLLMRMMDEGERAAFKRALKEKMLEGERRFNEDGEISEDAATLAALLDEDEKRRLRQ